MSERHRLPIKKKRLPHTIDIGRSKDDPTKEPILGPGGPYFVIMFFLGFPISALATLLVTGELPYWLRWMLQ